MRAIVINAEEQAVNEAEIDGSLKSLQNIVGGLIDPVYPGLEGTEHHCYVNDEGLLNSPQHFFMLRDGHQPLAGNGVILGTTDDGDEASCTLPLDWVKERVAFMDLQAVREWAAREPGQEVLASFVDRPERENAEISGSKTETKRTPGPWEDNGSGLIYGQVSGDEDEAPFVADCAKDGASGFYSNEEQANARLIAAAPDMLEALEFVRMTFADMEASKRKGYYTECPKVVAAAIAQAEGNNAEITDSKAAKKEALAKSRAETERSIQQAQERDNENSR